MSLTIKNLSFSIGKFALKNVSFTISNREYFILLGPTASGKTTLLKSILGIHNIKEGNIILNGRNISSLPVEKRNIGYLPQNLMLFPHLNVKENIIFGMRIRNMRPSIIEKKIGELEDLLQINHLLNRSVHDLSGGEKQKVSLARSLAIEPDLLLLDEPFSLIDEGTKRRLWFDIKTIFKKVNLPVIHITHDLEEAFSLGEKIGVMINGELKQFGAAEEIFEKPRDESITKLLNYRNLYNGKVIQSEGPLKTVQTENFDLVIRTEKEIPDELKLCIRPQHIKFVVPGRDLKPDLSDNVFSGRIKSVIFYMDSVSLLFSINGSSAEYDFEIKLPVFIYKRHELYEGKEISVAVWQKEIIIL